MTVGSFTLSGRFLGFGGAPSLGRVRIDGVPLEVVDPVADRYRIGPTMVKLDKLGEFSVTLPTDVTSGQSSVISYDVSVDLRHVTLPTIHIPAAAAGASITYLNPSQPLSQALGNIGVDTDGVFYLGATLGQTILRDTDGQPYVAAAGAVNGLGILTDTDGTPYAP